MSDRFARLNAQRPKSLEPENKTLVVVLSTLQLLAIILVWLLAIGPAALLALAVLARKAILASFRS